MLVRNRRSLEVISISALDLFASALGVFILMALILFPYYLKQPSIEQDLDGAKAEQSAAGVSLTRAQQIASEAEQELADAEALRSRAKDELQLAEASKADADKILATAARRAEQKVQKKAAKEEEDARLNVTHLDLVFVMDATGSMREEIRDVQANLLGIVRILHRLAPSLNVGFVAYKDRGDEYLTRSFPLAPMTDNNLRRIESFVQRLRAGGGGDFPEPVGVALNESVAMNWRPEALGWIIIVGDAPSHPRDIGRTYNTAKQFNFIRPAGPANVTRRVSTIYTGNRGGRDARFFQELAQLGGGDYVAHRGQMVESVLLSVLAGSER